jgi:hypothetical protein
VDEAFIEKIKNLRAAQDEEVLKGGVYSPRKLLLREFHFVADLQLTPVHTGVDGEQVGVGNAASFGDLGAGVACLDDVFTRTGDGGFAAAFFANSYDGLFGGFF